MGIEPTWPAWKAGVLPLNYTRIVMTLSVTKFIIPYRRAVVKGFARKILNIL